ncbi:hypothetical protein IV203_002622 [Nitzschia inconspicua]|uniref:Uncharacterized protein n=1 Tax=Nitzschia inconspicua TaxID=303405 RepID=A0A9K3P8L4_9STRA|nr:hypothetical protein IV203_002622 [Nitzschia inconspicua]
MFSNDSVSSRSMQKWGIPETQRVSNEQTLLERLVWVKNKGHWWPALLYQNYAELQTYLYDRLDMDMKARFAVAIMKELQNPQQTKFRVARLLGHDKLEIVDVKEGQFVEFYFQLSNVLPDACDRSRYGSDVQMYIDFHRALDQVEEIIQEISQNEVNVLPGGNKKTWEQRARESLKKNPSNIDPKPKQVTDKNEGILDDDGILDGFDTFMATLSKGVDDLLGNESPKQVTNSTRKVSSWTATDHSAPVDRYNAVVQPPQFEVLNRGYSSDQFSSTRAVLQEARDPSDDCRIRRRGSHANGGKNGNRNGSWSTSRRARSIELLPGLEAEDILPGITETDVWKNVLEHMFVSKNHTSDEMEEVSAPFQRSSANQRQIYQDPSATHERKPSYGNQHLQDATVSANQMEPKYKDMPIGGMGDVDRSVEKQEQLYQYRSTPVSTVSDGARLEPHEDIRSGSDMILAEEPRRSRNGGLNPNSDDTLWGFLTCRATDF